MTRLRLTTVTLAIAVASLSGHAQQLSNGDTLTQRLFQVAYSSMDDNLIGTWLGASGNDYANYQITLTLRSDGTYTKTLSIGGYGGYKGLGGTHQGTWTCSGSIVYLSGDGNWPASTVNLVAFRKIN